MQATDDSIWDWNLKTNAIYFSSRWKTMLGDREHEMNSLDEWFSRIHPGDVERIKMEILGSRIDYYLKKINLLLHLDYIRCFRFNT